MGISSSAPWLKYYGDTPHHLDYPSKTIPCTRTIVPSGDIEKDMREIKLYFKNFKGKHPEYFSIGNI